VEAEMVLFRSTQKEYVGIGYDEFCCTQEKTMLGLCGTLGELILDSSVVFKPVFSGQDLYQSNEADDIFYWPHFVNYNQSTKSLEFFAKDKIVLKDTGVWYLLLLHCNGNYDLEVNGNIAFMNPTGYLSAALFPFLPLYALLSLSFLGLGIWWIVLSLRHRNGLMGLQYLTAVVIGVGLLECLVWFGNFYVNNLNGYFSEAEVVIGSIFTMVKLTIIRALLFLVVLGYSITFTELSSRQKWIVGTMITVYAIAVGADEYVDMRVSLDEPVQEVTKMLVNAAMVFVELFYTVLIARELYHKLKTLKEQKQTLRYALYFKLAVFLGISMIISVVIYGYQIAVSLKNAQDAYWRLYWIFDAYWEIVYYALVVLIAWMWKPNPNNAQYAVADQLVEEDVGDVSLDAVPTKEGHDDSNSVSLEE